ncbi:MAG: phosphoribosylaminoimidazolesuccinocarboxamide synthase [Aquificae bacterium]|nr:phosphoribosylaminoimidazolesuccinocarboxamide synthase [Aquificota bacterium]
MKRRKLYEGKAKVVYETDEPDKLVLEFKDEASAFDGLKKARVEGKGALNNAISSALFELLESRGIKTHFIKKLSEREMLVYRAERFPLEVVVRNYAAGSFVKRYGVKEGTPLEPPLVEFFLKSDELHDPMVCEEHVRALKLAPPELLPEMKKLALKVNEVLRELFKKKGIRLVDFKLEMGILPDGNLAVVDELSPDSMRLWDERTGEKLDKDRFRFGLGDLLEGYKEVLSRLKN